MSKKKIKRKRASGQKQKIPPALKVYRKKIDKIRQLEEKYWSEIRKRRYYLSETAPDINDNLEAFFPSNISSRIYASIDGVVLLRYVISNLPSVNLRYSISMKRWRDFWAIYLSLFCQEN